MKKLIHSSNAMSPATDQIASVQPPDIVLQDIALAYRNVVAIEGLSGRFVHGSLTAIVGTNGAGKTTLLKGLLGLMRPAQGRIQCPWTSREMAYLSQASEIDRRFPITVADFVAVGLWRRVGGLRAVNRPLKQSIRDAVIAVGLQDFEQAWINDLSGGQFQRVRFARLLVQDAPVVLLDEPFAGIDSPTVLDLLHLIDQWHAASKTVITVLHDLELVKAYFPNTLVLSGKKFFWDQTEQSLSAFEQSNREQRRLPGPSSRSFS